MGENEVLNDLGDIRVALLDTRLLPPIIIQNLIALVDEKMTKYRGKDVIIKEVNNE